MRYAIMLFVVGCGKVIESHDGTVTVAVPPDQVFVRQGEMHDLAVTVTREGNFDGDVEVGAADLPAGVTATPLTIGAGETTGTLALAAGAAATQGLANIRVTASGDGAPAADAPLKLLVGGAPGTVDTSFAGDGSFTTIVPGMVLISRALAIRDDDKILVTGSTATQTITARIDTAGALDPSFGGAGFVSTGSGAFSEGIALAPVGDSVFVAGVANGNPASGDDDFGIFKYTTDGVLDTTFGASGVVTFDPGAGFGEIHSMVVAPDGNLFVSGNLFASTGVTTTRTQKYSAAGVRDPSFDVVEMNAVVEGILLQPDGKLVVAGSQGNNFWLARYLPNGQRDTGFGSGGIATTAFGTDPATIHGLFLVAGGKLLAVGVAGNTMTSHVVVARYNANGSADLAFGVGGTIATTVPFNTFAPNSGAIDATGRILLAGFVGSPQTPAVVRLDAAGAVDATFGMGGVATVDFGIAGATQKTGAYGVAFDHAGRIVFAGEVGPGGGQNMAVARLWP